MPQMAPLSWISLYIFFTILFSLSIVVTYYSFLYPPIKPTLKIKDSTINWKW